MTMIGTLLLMLLEAIVLPIVEKYVIKPIGLWLKKKATEFVRRILVAIVYSLLRLAG